MVCNVHLEYQYFNNQNSIIEFLNSLLKTLSYRQSQALKSCLYRSITARYVLNYSLKFQMHLHTLINLSEK